MHPAVRPGAGTGREWEWERGGNGDEMATRWQREREWWGAAKGCVFGGQDAYGCACVCGAAVRVEVRAGAGAPGTGSASGLGWSLESRWGWAEIKTE